MQIPSEFSPIEPIALPLPEAARVLGCTLMALRRLIWAGKIRHAKLGKRYVVPVAELRQFIEKELVRL